MAPLYFNMKVTLNKDYIRIYNDSSSVINITIYEENNSDVILVNTSIDSGNFFEYLPPKDQVYIINDENNTLTRVYYFYYTLRVFLSRFFSTICNCSCSSCYDIPENKDNLYMLSLLGDRVKLLINNGCSYFSAIQDTFNSLIFKNEACSPERVIIDGEQFDDYTQELEDSIKFKSILDYLSFYRATVETNEDTSFIDELFNINNIDCCLLKYRLNKEYTLDKIINMGTFTINSAEYINQAPDAVGDYTLDVNNRAVTTLTRAMFTTDTSPAYHDPEGDPADAIRIDSLPQDGILKFNGNPVSVGDIILMSDIDNGLLVYESPDTDSADTDTFDFSVRDTGSMTFVS